MCSHSMRLLIPEESGQAVELIRSAFPPEFLGRTPYAASGMAVFLANSITPSSTSPAHSLIGCFVDNALAGVAHVRALPSSWHLNMIAVAPESRHSGIGTRLLKAYLDYGKRNGFSTFTLDVEISNATAASWYTELGFVSTHETWIYCLNQQEVSRTQSEALPAGVRILDWEDARAPYAKYGLCQFRVVVGDEEWLVGQFAAWFRITRWPSHELRVALRALDPDRRLLVLTDRPISCPGASLLGRSQRMQKRVISE